MKKIITKISLKPLLTLFLKKKTVRKQSDIVVQKPKAKKQVKRSNPPQFQIAKLNNAELAAFAAQTLNSLEDHALAETLGVLTDDFQFAILEHRQNNSPISLDHLIKARRALRNCLTLLQIKEKQAF